MPSPAPSTQMLQHLARLCRATSTSIRQPATRPRAYSICARSSSSIRSQEQKNRNRNVRLNSCIAIPRRSTTSSAVRAAEPAESASSSSSSSSATEDSPILGPLPNISTYYTLFPKTIPSGAPPEGSFTIPLAELKREFLQLQSQFHPDKFTPGTPAHRKSLGLSSLINNAYKTLSSPLLRAQYLLLQNYNIDVNTEDNSTFKTDSETLMDVMEAQEQIEEATSQEEIDVIRDENMSRIEETVSKLESAFEDGDVASATTECVRLKYWTSLQQGLNDWEPGKEVRLIH